RCFSVRSLNGDGDLSVHVFVATRGENADIITTVPFEQSGVAVARMLKQHWQSLPDKAAGECGFLPFAEFTDPARTQIDLRLRYFVGKLCRGSSTANRVRENVKIGEWTVFQKSYCL